MPIKIPERPIIDSPNKEFFERLVEEMRVLDIKSKRRRRFKKAIRYLLLLILFSINAYTAYLLMYAFA